MKLLTGRATVTAAVLAAALLIPTAAPALGSTTRAAQTAAPAIAPGEDVMNWFADVDPDIAIDRTCIKSGEPVAYPTDQIVLRTDTPATATAQVDKVLKRLSGPPPGGTWVTNTQQIVPPQPPTGPPITKALLVNLKHPTEGVHDIVTLARRLRTGEVSIPASPNYAMSPSPYVSFWPNGFPTIAPALAPQRTLLTPAGDPIGTGITVAVYDTGLAPGNDPRLVNVRALTPADAEKPDRNGDGLADLPFSGHGKAIAGIIATLTPGAEIVIARITERNGLATDVDAADRITTSLRNAAHNLWPELAVNAFGSLACDLTATQPATDVTPLQPIAMEMVAEVVDRFAPIQPHGMLLVTSAGNRKTSRPFYPAGFNLDPGLAPFLLGVGAIDGTLADDGDPSEWFSKSRTGPASWFSNWGAWVDVWAPGEHLATTHLVGLAFDDGTPSPPVLQGEAFGDGTSLAAPYVAALIAERMSTATERAGMAWGAIQATGAAPLPPCDGTTSDVGSGVAIALVSISSFATDLGTPPPGTCPS